MPWVAYELKCCQTIKALKQVTPSGLALISTGSLPSAEGGFGVGKHDERRVEKPAQGQIRT